MLHLVVLVNRPVDVRAWHLAQQRVFRPADAERTGTGSEAHRLTELSHVQLRDVHASPTAVS